MKVFTNRNTKMAPENNLHRNYERPRTTRDTNRDKEKKSITLSIQAYGSNKPLVVQGSFIAQISTEKVTDSATFYVIKYGSRDLLVKTIAIKLRVLKILINVNNIVKNVQM